MNIVEGTELGRYKIRGKLGAGGMGEVFLAEDTSLHRNVALKILPEAIAGDKGRLQRFEQEARAVSTLNHPNILTVYEFGNHDGIHFLATELIEGRTLRDEIAGGRLPVPQALNIAENVAFALSAAHSAGIVHRDLKPENIMIRRDGIIKVLDFGLAKLLEEKPASPDTEAETRALVKTNPGAVMGTAAYMSPEQAKGKDADGRTDIWSLGVVLYEMVAGRMPFEGESANEVIASILKSDPAPLSRILTEIPHELERIVGKTLRKDREERYQHVKDLWIDLRDLKQELEFNAKLERSTAPNYEPSNTAASSAPPNEITDSKMVALTDTSGGPSPYRADTHPSSSAEYLVSEIKRHKFGSFVALAALVVAIAGAGWWVLNGRTGSASTTHINSIAVLPFENGSGDAGLDYLSDGLSESLIDKLAQLSPLKVIARASSFKYRGANIDIADVASKLGVQAIVMGKVTKQGDQLMVRVEMVDAANNNQLWGEQYSRKAADALTLQQDIAQTVSEKLHLQLTGAQARQLAKRDTVNPEAYELLLRGRFFNNQGRLDSHRRALEFLEKAVAADPNFALAYSDLSLAYGSFASSGDGDPKVYVPKSEAAALRAIQLDNNLSEAHVALARYYRESWRWEEARAEYKLAIELDNNSSRAHGSYGNLLCELGQYDEGLEHVRRARELDPLSVAEGLGYALVWARRYDDAISELKRVSALNPDDSAPLGIMAYAYSGKGMYKEAINAMEEANRKGGSNSSSDIYLGAYYAKGGNRDKAQAILKQLQSTKEYVSPGELAILYTALGDKDAALALLEKAYDAHDLQLQFLKVEGEYDPLRSDPRFIDLMRRVGLPA